MINKTAAIIAGAGAGNRLGANLPKALVKLVDKTLVEHAVSSLAPVAQLLIVTAPAGFEDEFRKVLGDQVTVITGGILRSDSIRLALAQIPNNFEYVFVHDAARCLATTTLAKSDLFVILSARSSPAITFTATPSASTKAASSVASSLAW